MKKQLDRIEHGAESPPPPSDPPRWRPQVVAEAIAARKVRTSFFLWKQRTDDALKTKNKPTQTDTSSSSTSDSDESPSTAYLNLQKKLRQQLDRLNKAKNRSSPSTSSSNSTPRQRTQSPQTQSEIKISLSSGSGRLTQSSIRNSAEKPKRISTVTFTTPDTRVKSSAISLGSLEFSTSSSSTPTAPLSDILRMASFSDSSS